MHSWDKPQFVMVCYPSDTSVYIYYFIYFYNNSIWYKYYYYPYFSYEEAEAEMAFFLDHIM